MLPMLFERSMVLRFQEQKTVTPLVAGIAAVLWGRSTVGIKIPSCFFHR
jgi:hypothetical protein